MALILNIDTSGSRGLVALAEDGICIAIEVNSQPMEHASFLQEAVKRVLQKANFFLQQVDAVAVSNGPGSYTGLRVGLASAKGLCFALKKPLITLNTLELMASACQKMTQSDTLTNNAFFACFNKDGQPFQTPDTEKGAFLPALYCPMIDARRMEVFFGLYNYELQSILQPAAAVIEPSFLHDLLENHIIIFTGNGSEKWKKICIHPHAAFSPEPLVDKAFCELSYQRFAVSLFDNLVLSEPYYCKEFYTVSSGKDN